jgi:class 3 adenylate cyclase/16S rRNA G966 N2-methylase RsmD
MTVMRRLAAIISADVVGYSTAMERDEEGTFARVKELVQGDVEPSLPTYNGRLIKTLGDGFLAEFQSPIEALRFALSLQTKLASDPSSLQLRVGLNLGDVIIDGGDVFGEGVNIASRLQEKAPPRGIVISEKMFREVEWKVNAIFEYLGEFQLKNMTRPIKIYSVKAPASETAAAASPAILAAETPSFFESIFCDALGDAVRSYIHRRDIKLIGADFASTFTKRYFFQNSSLLLLKASLSVTNISLVEIQALLRLNTKTKESDGPVDDIYFENSRDLKRRLAEIWESNLAHNKHFSLFLDAAKSLHEKGDATHGKVLSDFFRDSNINASIDAYVESAYPLFAALHGRQFSRTILLDPYSCSVAVSAAFPLLIDFHSVVGQSGYIHSFGDLLYIRNARKSRISEIKEKLAQLPDSEQCPLLIFDEDFDRSRPRFVRVSAQIGLDHLKIPKNKYYADGKPLADAVYQLEKDPILSRKIKVLWREAASPRDELARFSGERDAEVSLGNCIFLLRDFAVNESSQRSNSQYLICYQRQYRNSSPCAIFDETKPGWYAPVTLPHTLCAAMINICRPFLRRDAAAGGKQIVLMDPFAGSGTTALEARRIFGNEAITTCSDQNRISRLIVDDNCTFFAMQVGPKVGVTATSSINDMPNTLEALDAVLKLVAESPLEEPDLPGARNDVRVMAGSALRPASGSVRDTYRWCLRTCSAILRGLVDDTEPLDFESNLRKLRDFKFPEARIDTLANLPVIARIIFYIVWRSTVLNSAFVSVGIERLHESTRRIIVEFREQLQELMNVRQIRSGDKLILGELLSQRGVYSPEIICPAISFTRDAAKPVWLRNESPRHAVATLAAYRDAVDMIVTDPPYGFSTIEETGAMVELYKDFMKGCIEALRDRGQLVLCMPDESHNGQSIPSYAQGEWFDREIRSVAKQPELRCDLFSVYPQEASMIGGKPLFWRSERALTRRILHYIVRKRVT